MESEHSIDGREGLRARNQRNFDVQSSSEGEEDHDHESELEDPGTESDEEEEEEEEEDEEEVGVKPVEAAPPPPPSDTSQSKKRAKIEHDFILYKSWDLGQHEAADVHTTIKVELAKINTQAGINNLKTSQHHDRNNIYGDWIYSRHWLTSGGAISNKVFRCPLARLTKCKCLAKISENAREIKLYISDMHTYADHGAARDKSKYLNMEQRQLVADAVKIAPQQTASELMRNIQNSPTKKIDPRLKTSVQRLIYKERKKLNSVILDDIEITDEIAPLQEYTSKIWISQALKIHKAGVRSQEFACIPMHKVFCIGRAFNADEVYTMLAFATPWNLLNYFRALGSGYPVLLQGDVTGKASSLALNKLGLGYNRLGGHFCSWTTTLIPAEQESQETYTNAYNAARAATRGLIKLPSCERESCHTCRTLVTLRSMPLVRSSLDSHPFTALGQLAISQQLGDSNDGWQNTCRALFGTNSRVCQTHASSINGLNGRFRKHFSSQAVYEEFYDFVCRIMRVSMMEHGFYLQTMLVDLLKARGEDDAAVLLEL
jgi:hypothetical protein